MKLFLNNLIPRVKQFSNTLDKKEVFVEIPWVIVDDNLDQQKYIFQRNGDLIMSLNGEVNIGRWEYISAAKSLLIDRIKDKILLNLNFVDSSVMILKKDGFKDENLMLANEILLPNLNVLGYLQKLFYSKNNISIVLLKTGQYLELYNYQGYFSGNKVTIEGDSVSDGYLELQSGKKIQIKDSIILRVLVRAPYKTDKGTIIIEHGRGFGPERGDQVFIDNLPAPDGKYRLGFLKNIFVQNGLIV